MSTATADAKLTYDALNSPPHGDKVLWTALGFSLLLHAAAVALLPGLRVPEPKANVLTVELQRAAETPSPAPHRATKKSPRIRAEKPFERAEIAPVLGSAAIPQPKEIDPRTEVAVAPRSEPYIAREPTEPQPLPIARAEPRLNAVEPVLQPRLERPAVELAPSKPEPMIERRAQATPLPTLAPEVEPRAARVDPTPALKPDRRVEPAATSRAEPALEAPRAQPTLAQPAIEAPPVPKFETLPMTAHVERRAEVHAAQRTEPVIALQPGPTADLQQPQTNIAPTMQRPIERAQPPVAEARPDPKPAMPVQHAQSPSRAETAPQTARVDVAPAAPSPQTMPQASAQRRVQPNIAAPGLSPPEVRRTPRLETALAPAPLTPAVASPVEPSPLTTAKPEPVIANAAPLAPPPAAPVKPLPQADANREPVIANAAPSAPVKRNRADEEAAIRLFASAISRQLSKGVSSRDYPPLARDRRWEGTTQLVLLIQPNGKLSDVSVGTSSGYQVLDQRAIELVNQLKLPAVPDEIHSRAFSVRVPVTFALRD